jgi:nucleoside-diphosphate-sugar epimerase
MARRASDIVGAKRRIIAVSRFSNESVRRQLEQSGVETWQADLFRPEAVANLPDAGLVYFLLGRKFGTTGSEPLTWASNVSLPTIICQRFPQSRIAALSTLCVYPFVAPSGGGSRESDPAQPTGEYAMSTLGRERVFEHYSVANSTPVVLIRLSYAVELRYGVLVDIATRIWLGQPVDISMPYVNVIWQADAIARILVAASLASTPARVVNVAGHEHYSVRELARQLGEFLQRDPEFTGQPADDAWLPAPSSHAILSGPSRVPIDRLLRWTAEWVKRPGPSYNKPTRFEVRDGRF